MPTREFACGKDDFMVRSDEDWEVLEAAKRHMSKRHDIDATDRDVKEKWKESASAHTH